MLVQRQKPDRALAAPPYLRIAAAAGLMCMAAIGADQVRAQGIVNTAPPPLSMLVKFQDRDYEIAYADWISLDPVHSATVRKIGYGRVSEVNIATTSTGTYSSDALMSPHVLYPGISVQPVPPEARHGRAERVPGTSIFRIGRSPSGALTYTRISPNGFRTCVARGSFMTCTTR